MHHDSGWHHRVSCSDHPADAYVSQPAAAELPLRLNRDAARVRQFERMNTGCPQGPIRGKEIGEPLGHRSACEVKRAEHGDRRRVTVDTFRSGTTEKVTDGRRSRHVTYQVTSTWRC